MKVFTITTKHPEWEALTEECVRRVKEFSGHEVEVVQAKDQWDAHVLKLTIPLRHNCFLWFVDSDWWPVKPFEFPKIPEGGFSAIQCTTGLDRYITTCADTSKVFATTILGMDMVSWKARHCFRHAKAKQTSSFWDGKPRMDEFFLNLAVLPQNLPVDYMSGNWAWNGPVTPEAIAVHAGGIWPKVETLKRWCRHLD